MLQVFRKVWVQVHSDVLIFYYPDILLLGNTKVKWSLSFESEISAYDARELAHSCLSMHKKLSIFASAETDITLVYLRFALIQNSIWVNL